MTVKGALQAITHHLPPWIAATGTAILGDPCYTSLIYDVEPTRICLRLALSKALGIGIIVFGSVLKIPQIVTIVRHASAWGISLSMYSLEVVAYDISLAYAFRKKMPFSTYGENASLTLQNMIITLLIIWYGSGTDAAGEAKEKGMYARRHAALTARKSVNGHSIPMEAPPSLGISDAERAWRQRQVFLAAAAMAFGTLFVFVLCPAPLLSVLQAFSIPISLTSKFPQIAELHRNKQPGHLSSIVVFAQLAGTLARVYTTITETGDWLLGIGFGLASVLNAVIAVQYVYYWDGRYARSTPLPLTTVRRTASIAMTGKPWSLLLDGAQGRASHQQDKAGALGPGSTVANGTLHAKKSDAETMPSLINQSRPHHYPAGDMAHATFSISVDDQPGSSYEASQDSLTHSIRTASSGGQGHAPPGRRVHDKGRRDD